MSINEIIRELVSPSIDDFYNESLRLIFKELFKKYGFKKGWLAKKLNIDTEWKIHRGFVIQTEPCDTIIQIYDIPKTIIDNPYINNNRDIVIIPKNNIPLIFKKIFGDVNNFYIYPISKNLLSQNFRVTLILGDQESDYKIDDLSLIQSCEIQISNNVNKKYINIIQKRNTELLSHMAYKIQSSLNGIIFTNDQLKQHTNPHMEAYMLISALSDEIGLAIADSIDLIKIELNMFQLKKEKFYFRHCINDALNLVQILAKTRNIEIITTIDESLPEYVYADQKRIYHILVALLYNAIHYSCIQEPQPIYFDIRSEMIAEDNIEHHEITFIIKDNGIGMNAEIQKNIFEHYTTFSDHSINSRGISLVLAKKIAKIMQGDIELIESSPHNGSTFAFTVNVYEEEQPEYDTSSFRYLSNKNVIICDDQITRRVTLFTILTKWKIDVNICASLAELKMMYLESNVDLFIITDNIDGVSTKSIIEQIQKRNTSVIVIKNNQNYSDIIYDNVINYPIEETKLIRCIVDIFMKQKPQLLKPYILHKTHKNINILLIEENMINQDNLIKTLNIFGYNRIITQPNGAVALDHIINYINNYHIIIIGLRITLINGVELAQKIIDLYNEEKINRPVLIGITSQPQINDFCNYDMFDAVIYKPINRDELKKILDSIEITNNVAKFLHHQKKYGFLNKTKLSPVNETN